MVCSDGLLRVLPKSLSIEGSPININNYKSDIYFRYSFLIRQLPTPLLLNPIQSMTLKSLLFYTFHEFIPGITVSNSNLSIPQVEFFTMRLTCQELLQFVDESLLSYLRSSSNLSYANRAMQIARYYNSPFEIEFWKTFDIFTTQKTTDDSSPIITEDIVINENKKGIFKLGLIY